MISLFPTGWAHYLAGGLLIGSGLTFLFVTTGLVGGMSTVFSSTWSYVSRAAFFQQRRLLDSRVWRLVYAAGLVLGGALWWLLFGPSHAMHTGVPAWQLLVGGVLVGYGARRANGCTSGHGVCGLSSLNPASLVAVLTFMAAAIATARLVLAVKGA